jgi:hypothetical protein
MHDNCLVFAGHGGNSIGRSYHLPVAPKYPQAKGVGGLLAAASAGIGGDAESLVPGAPLALPARLLCCGAGSGVSTAAAVRAGLSSGCCQSTFRTSPAATFWAAAGCERVLAAVGGRLVRESRGCPVAPLDVGGSGGIFSGVGWIDGPFGGPGTSFGPFDAGGFGIRRVGFSPP